MEPIFSFFEWFEGSLLAHIGQNYGAVYALVGQSVHLMALAVLGGAVLVTDLRLLGVVLKDAPAEVVAENAHKWFKVAVVVMILTGIFMAAAIAMRMYYSLFFWSKMTSLAIGILFVFFIKMPLIRRGVDSQKPWLIKLVAVASLCIWFTVAATGRWIGFS
jgi:hypothetical protein